MAKVCKHYEAHMSIDVIAYHTRLPRCMILEQIVALSQKYAANADDISEVAAKGVLAGRMWPEVAEVMAGKLAKGVLPIDIMMNLYRKT
jgi:hypothetical protein